MLEEHREKERAIAGWRNNLAYYMFAGTKVFKSIYVEEEKK
jgi:hypothetical protein